MSVCENEPVGIVVVVVVCGRTDVDWRAARGLHHQVVANDF